MKANSNQAVVKTLVDLGAGIDVVSEGELRRALALWAFPAARSCFRAIGKTAREMALALKEGIACFNVESEPELELLSSVATRIGSRATVSIRINPDVDAKTHAQDHNRKGREQVPASRISGHAERVYAQGSGKLAGDRCSRASTCISAARSPSLNRLRRPSGCMARPDRRTLRERKAMISAISIWAAAWACPIAAPMTCRRIPMNTPTMVKQHAGSTLGCRLVLEPGRMITGNAGILVSRVIYVKSGRPPT